MRWEDEGILLSSRAFGENNAIVQVLTLGHGLHAGLVKYGYTQKNSSLLEPGVQLNLSWRARLNEQLGVFLLDKVKSRTSALIQNKQTLLGFNSIIAILLLTLPEREPFQNIYRNTINLVDLMSEKSSWLAHYVRWELLILAELGFGLDLSMCAVTGKNEELIYVSPRSGRAVSAEAGKAWADKLIALPQFLISESDRIETDPLLISKGMRLTGYFLEKWMLQSLDKQSLPEARHRFFISLTN